MNSFKNMKCIYFSDTQALIVDDRACTYCFVSNYFGLLHVKDMIGNFIFFENLIDKMNELIKQGYHSDVRLNDISQLPGVSRQILEIYKGNSEN